MRLSRALCMAQAVNVDALRLLGRVAWSPGLATPHLQALHAARVDWRKLRQAGLRGVVFDKDNTLTSPYGGDVHELVVPAVAACRDVFGSAVVIMSNSAGGPDDKGYVEANKVEAALGLDVLRRQCKKPGGFQDLISLFRSFDGLGNVEPHELAMVGDRLLTDVVFGNIHGMLTIHVQPLTLRGDNPVALVVRAIENSICLPVASRFGALPPPHPFVKTQVGLLTSKTFLLDEVA
eukprot:TRINITY_DN49554_c0_g1_i1.p1 TRINITY_DN49554_c0_g1~~TRINITY_DN49554_c0_g1_i1.p1  ORF type:complete len:235 (+),score=35.93 TRINITY_DN49554_c0_g1_i1:76-780(+)